MSSSQAPAGLRPTREPRLHPLPIPDKICVIMVHLPQLHLDQPCIFCNAALRPPILCCTAAYPIFAGTSKTTRKGNPMSTILSTIQTRLRQRAAYLRTKAELEAMPLDVAIDLDIYKPDAARIAEKAVYGR
jgi:hypothetical protein